MLNLLKEILLKLIAFFLVLIDHDEAAQGATELGLTDHALAEGRLDLYRLVLVILERLRQVVRGLQLERPQLLVLLDQEDDALAVRAILRKFYILH